MYTWHFGTYKKKNFAKEHNRDEQALVTLLSSAVLVEGAAIVYSELEEGTPPVLMHYLSNIPAIPRVGPMDSVLYYLVPKAASGCN